MRNTVKGFLFRLPAIIVLIGAFVVSFILKLSPSLSTQYGVSISWAPAVVLFLIVVAYFVGEYISAMRHSVYAV